MNHFSLYTLIAFLLISSPFILVTAVNPSFLDHAASERYYSRSHSLGDSYNFDSRDGWEIVNISNLAYKYQVSGSDLEKRVGKKVKGASKSSVGSVIKGAAVSLWKGLKAIGNPEAVVITWYTGQDLQNPSCWPTSDWAPTDASFACALTLEGWKSRPECFTFIELCNGSDKCIFVRVVDTCAGCKKGSKHVDLTIAAFSALGSLDAGILTVQQRAATEPEVWHTDLWGPKVNRTN
jgi:hypothetical protein